MYQITPINIEATRQTLQKLYDNAFFREITAIDNVYTDYINSYPFAHNMGLFRPNTFKHQTWDLLFKIKYKQYAEIVEDQKLFSIAASQEVDYLLLGAYNENFMVPFTKLDNTTNYIGFGVKVDHFEIPNDANREYKPIYEGYAKETESGTIIGRRIAGYELVDYDINVRCKMQRVEVLKDKSNPL